MAERRQPVEAEIGRRLDAALTTDSPNRITAAELREWTLEYLRERDEDVAEFPEEAGKAHWDLWMMDARLEDALFAALVFRPDGVEFFCGTGDSFKVRHFCGHDFPEEPGDLFEAMRQQFAIPEDSLHLGRKTAEEWLGRGW
jgi:hypothetical protein